MHRDVKKIERYGMDIKILVINQKLMMKIIMYGISFKYNKKIERYGMDTKILVINHILIIKITMYRISYTNIY
jgi:hypothetical protein